jgi:glucose-6-phosphate isomerase
MVQLNLAGVREFISPEEIDNIASQVQDAHLRLHSGTGPGAEMRGWLNWPRDYDKTEFAQILAAAQEIREGSDALVVIGIGGSYLGARAAIELLGSSFPHPGSPSVYYAGHTLSGTYHADLLDHLKDKDFSVNVISKSGTTTEPAVAFRLFRTLLEEKYGKDGARRRIYATTDGEKGALLQLARQEGYRTFTIPQDIGGRYSVLTPVGLLPMAAAGIDIQAVLKGAAEAMDALHSPSIKDNPCYMYAALRNILCRKGRQIELLVGYEPALQTLAEWWKQLFGESEGKDGKGIFPASAIFSTDLHSLGQYIQEGRDILFETVLNVNTPRRQLTLPGAGEDLDGLKFLAGRTLQDINEKAFAGTLLAHCAGGVPNIVLELPRLDAQSFGHLVYFMEKACAISGYILGVNPFNQPGVEAYKKNMFALLGKPGYQEQRLGLEQRLRAMGASYEG